MEPPPPLESQTPPLHSKDRRFKPLWRILLISNLALGAYIFAQARMKKSRSEETKGSKRRSKDTKTADGVSSVPSKAVNDSPDPTLPKAVDVASAPATIPPIPEETPLPPPAPVLPRPMKVPDPIPEDQQRELFKWLLEEKRKVKPKSPEEKKRIDEEKAILKQFIRAQHIPKI